MILVPCALQKLISKDLEMEQNAILHWFIMLQSKEWVLFQVTLTIVIRYAVQFALRLLQME